MNIIAWIVLGAIAGYLAGFLVRGDEGLGVIGHIVLGIVGALVGGFLASVLFNVKLDGPLDITTIVVSVIGAIIVVVLVNLVTTRSRSTV
jgi:uncharacterized membrane protein YeaQ/YmgE (transglycosylase-associated protein family)